MAIKKCLIPVKLMRLETLSNYLLVAAACMFLSPTTVTTTQQRAAISGVATDKPALHITSIQSLKEIPEQPAGTIYFFDIDDTLIDHPHMLGSKGWRSYFSKAIDPNKKPHSNHDKITLDLAKKQPVMTVETDTALWLQQVQAQGHATYGLTARERNIWYYTPCAGVDQLTTQQLASVGILFDQDLPSDMHSITQAPEYFRGTFFSDLDSKGEYLIKLFQASPQKPLKVIFVDDKQDHAEGVAQALAYLGVDYECYWYRATENKASKFDPLIANVQLYYVLKFDQILSDDEARLIAEQTPENNYLQEVKALLHLSL